MMHEKYLELGLVHGKGSVSKVSHYIIIITLITSVITRGTLPLNGQGFTGLNPQPAPKTN